MPRFVTGDRIQSTGEIDEIRINQLYPLEKRRLREDLIEMYKILNEKERADKAKFFSLLWILTD